MPLRDVTFELSSPYAGDLADYSVNFVSDIPIDVHEDCYVKYIFYGIGLVEASSMLRDTVVEKN